MIKGLKRVLRRCLGSVAQCVACLAAGVVMMGWPCQHGRLRELRRGRARGCSTDLVMSRSIIQHPQWKEGERGGGGDTVGSVVPRDAQHHVQFTLRAGFRTTCIHSFCNMYK